MVKKYEITPGDTLNFERGLIQGLTAIANELAELNKNIMRLKGE